MSQERHSPHPHPGMTNRTAGHLPRGWQVVPSGRMSSSNQMAYIQSLGPRSESFSSLRLGLYTPEAAGNLCLPRVMVWPQITSGSIVQAQRRPKMCSVLGFSASAPVLVRGSGMSTWVDRALTLQGSACVRPGDGCKDGVSLRGQSPSDNSTN